MKFLRQLLDSQHENFTTGKFSKLYPIYEAIDTFAFTPGEVTQGNTHLRDGLDLKRLMVTVAVALSPCLLMALFNTGYQANAVLFNQGASEISGWRGALFSLTGLPLDPANYISNIVHGALYFVPIFIVTNIFGGLWEVLFSVVRKHEVNEGFMITGILGKEVSTKLGIGLVSGKALIVLVTIRNLLAKKNRLGTKFLSLLFFVTDQSVPRGSLQLSSLQSKYLLII